MSLSCSVGNINKRFAPSEKLDRYYRAGWVRDDSSGILLFAARRSRNTKVPDLCPVYKRARTLCQGVRDPVHGY